MFIGVHAMLAAQTNTPELMLQEDEAKAFMKAAQNVMRHYSVAATQKTLDWISFAGVAGGMYGTRFFAISMRRKMEAAERGGGEVLQFRRRPRAVDPVKTETPPAAAAPFDGGEYVPSIFPDAPVDETGGF